MRKRLIRQPKPVSNLSCHVLRFEFVSHLSHPFQLLFRLDCTCRGWREMDLDGLADGLAVLTNPLAGLDKGFPVIGFLGHGKKWVSCG